MNINTVKEEISRNVNRKVRVVVYGMRNKVNEHIGTINEIYPYIFTILCDGENKSFSYADVITKEVEIHYC